MASQVTLAWDPNTPTPEGYHIFQRLEGESYDYSSPVWPQPGDDPTQTTCTIDNLPDDTTFFFVVRAYVGSDQSGDSNEISFQSEPTPPNTYAISASSGSNGTITPSGNIAVNSGENRTFTFQPDNGYHVDSVSIDGQSVGALGSYSFSNITQNHAIAVNFVADTYTVNASAGSGGSISPAGSITVNHGASRTFIFSPQNGYHVANVQVDGQSLGAAGSYTFSNITQGHTIAVSFTTDAYTINASAGSGGSISPAGSISVSHGASQTFSFSPQNGYHVSNVQVDGQSLGAIASYAFSNITGHHTIAVSFSSTTYTITASSGTGGTISPSGVTTVALGGSRQFEAIPDTGYVLREIRVDGSSIGASSSYNFTNINANHTIEARFELGNQAPRAEAGSIQSADSNSMVTLNGSGSNDPEGGSLSYQWTQTNTPAVNLTNADQAMATFTAPDATGQSVTLAFELRVTDPQGLSSRDTCLVQVNPSSSVDTDGDGTPDDIDTDDDDDGMPDTWETQYGLKPLINDAGEDPDKDGYSNLEEYQAGTNPLEAGANRKPNTPTITNPQEGEERVVLAPRFMASDFKDPDAGDTHKQTQWQIVDTSSQQVVWDVTAMKKGLTSIRVQRLVLSPSTQYNAKVRYYDQDGRPSEWSSPVSFTTDTDKKDNNRNKIPDAQEAPASTDLNNDSIPDNDQRDIIMSVTTYNGDYLMAVSSAFDPNQAIVESVENVDPALIEERPANDAETPYGLMAYKIKVAQPGDSALVSIYLSSPVSTTATQWVSYDSVKGWQDCTGTTETLAGGIMAQHSIQDGGTGDADGTANGIIVELLGPQTAPPSQDPGAGLSLSDGDTASSGEGGNGTGCFINTLF